MEHFKDSANYQDKLKEYATMTYITCINAMIKLIVEKGVKVVILILTEARNSYRAPATSAQTIRVKLSEVSLTISED